MLVKEAMSPNPRMIRPGLSLMDAAKMMRRVDCGCLLVGENERPAGILTDRDIVIRGLAEDRDPVTTKARDVMTKEVAYCFADESLEDAAEAMKRKQIRRLAVHEPPRLEAVQYRLRSYTRETADARCGNAEFTW